MRRDGTVPGVGHILLHLAGRPGPVASKAPATAMATDPVTIWRIRGVAPLMLSAVPERPIALGPADRGLLEVTS